MIHQRPLTGPTLVSFTPKRRFLPSSPANQLQFSLTSCGVEGKGGLLSERIRIIMLFGKVELKYSRRQSVRGLSHSEKDSQIRFVII